MKDELSFMVDFFMYIYYLLLMFRQRSLMDVARIFLNWIQEFFVGVIDVEKFYKFLWNLIEIDGRK